NVLLTAAGEPKITDFGIAKKLDDDTSHTRTGAVMGTPAYMAPEQAAGQVRAIGPATDVYSLGSILYELLTGRPPFKLPTVMEALTAALNDDPLPPPRLNAKVPRDLETITLKCLQKDPYRRYHSAAELAADCAAFLDNRPITARPVGAVERAVKWVRRRPLVAALLVALALAIAGGFAGMTVLYLEAERERGVAEDARDLAEGRRRETEQARQEAVREKTEADKARGEAVTQRNNADEARKRAEAEKRRAEAARVRAESLVYAGKVSLAQSEWLGDNVRVARGPLHSCRRGWGGRGDDYPLHPFSARAGAPARPPPAVPSAARH